MSHSPVILLVEDDATIQRSIRKGLMELDYRILTAATLEEARSHIVQQEVDLAVLDLGLPDGDGLVVTRQLRSFTNVPILIVSARDRESDKVEVLDAGADDYVMKPFGTEELLARVRVALRHAASRQTPPSSVTVGPLTVDFESHLVSLSGAEVHLTPIEFKLLALLSKHVGKVVTHGQLLTEIWGPKSVEQTHYLRVHMAQLRRKIERTPARPLLLVTEAGVGYRLREPPL